MTPLMLIHVAAGSAGLAAGFAALALRKGAPAHRAAGAAFALAMLTMSGVGAALAAALPNRPTVLIGVLTFYLVATGWGAARRPEGRVGRLETAGFWAATALAMLALGAALASRGGALDGIPSGIMLLFAVVAGIGAAADLRVLRRGGVSGRERTARHLWRMCTALAIAAASFFLGQQDEFPAAIQGSPALMAPPLVALGALVFWLVRVRAARTPARA